ncbi:MAG: hypothetical protein WAX80_01485 [Minisyncoccia bacterium]
MKLRNLSSVALAILFCAFVFAVIDGVTETLNNRRLQNENAALKQALTGSAETVVELSNGARLKYITIDDVGDFVIGQVVEISSTSSDIYVLDKAGERDYTARFTTPLSARLQRPFHTGN